MPEKRITAKRFSWNFFELHRGIIRLGQRFHRVIRWHDKMHLPAVPLALLRHRHGHRDLFTCLLADGRGHRHFLRRCVIAEDVIGNKPEALADRFAALSRHFRLSDDHRRVIAYLDVAAALATLYLGCSTLLTIGPHNAAPSKTTARTAIIHHISFFLILLILPAGPQWPA